MSSVLTMLNIGQLRCIPEVGNWIFLSFPISLHHQILSGPPSKYSTNLTISSLLTTLLQNIITSLHWIHVSTSVT